MSSSKTASANITHRLVEHVTRRRYEHLSTRAVESTKTFILDSLGVALSGTRVPMVRELEAVAAEWGSGEAARIWGTGRRVPGATAAFINGYQIHNQEWDCVHEPAVVHPMAVVLSTLLAWCEARGGVSGRQLISGCSVAVDVATGIGRAARNKLRFFRPAMCGALGATAGLANIEGLGAATTRSALGLAYSQLSGTMQAHIEGSPVLPMQIGFNTRVAFDALRLARRGVRGPLDFLEGPFGYFTLMDPEWEPAEFAQLETREAITELSHKPFPSGRATHGGVDGVLTLREQHGFALEQIGEIRVQAPPLVIQLVDRAPSPDMAPSYARLCLPYVAATALLTGNVGVDDFEPTALADPRRHTLAARIRVCRDQNPSLNALAPQRVEISLLDGRELALDLPNVLGAPGRPLGRERHLAKFRRAAGSGLRPMSARAMDHLLQLVDDLEQLDELRRLVDALVFDSDTP
ncbi:MAG: MmgE/PrpD family protein [Gammaproteobacteria bacterium]